MRLPEVDVCHDGRAYRVIRRTPGAPAVIYPGASDARRAARWFAEYGAPDTAAALERAADKAVTLNAGHMAA